MKILNTGVTGFVGSELGVITANKGYEVWGIVRHVTARSREILLDE